MVIGVVAAIVAIALMTVVFVLVIATVVVTVVMVIRRVEGVVGVHQSILQFLVFTFQMSKLHTIRVRVKKRSTKNKAHVHSKAYLDLNSFVRF